MTLPHTPPAPPSRGVIVVAIVAVMFFAAAVVILASDSDASTARVGLLFALIGTVMPVLFATLRSDQAASQTNGTMDQRIHDAVTVALETRAASAPQDRAGDKPVP